MKRIAERRNAMAVTFPFTAPDKAVYALDGISNFRVHYLLQIDGHIQPPVLGRAIDHALARTPVLKSIARLNGRNPHWEVVEDLAPYPIFTFEDVSSPPGAAEKARERIYDYINAPMDITREPPANFRLIRFAEDRWTFVAKVHHCALDGIASFFLIRDILSAYNSLLSGHPPRGVDEIGDRGRWPLLRSVPMRLWGRLMWISLLRAVRYEKVEKDRCFARFSASPSPPGSISYRSVRLAGDDYQRLCSRCESLGITFNDLVITALCHTIHRWNQGRGPAEGIYTIAMPVDLRKYLEQNGEIPRVMSNYAGGTFVIIPTKVVTTAAETAAYVSTATRFLKDYHLALGQSLMLLFANLVSPHRLRKWVKRSHRRNPGKFVPTTVVSNVGRIDAILPSFHGCEIRGVDVVATAYDPGGLFFVVSSYRDVCTITVTYRQSVCPEAEIDEFVNVFSKEITSRGEAWARGAGQGN
jgi:NRPS condensation-like uncharacterized protein